MKNTLPQHWIDKLYVLDIAFQPILNIHTGKIFAVEALLRNFKEVGFESIFSLFDSVYEDGLLYSFDILLREKALIKFSKISNYESIKLFYNLDNRLLQMGNFSHGNTNRILDKLSIHKENICFEISERHEITGEHKLEHILKHYQEENFCIAIDDFGVGYSGYKLLYDSTPNLIKIDRFFIQDIENNLKKKILVANITKLAIQLGIKVVAEGIETKEELLTCKDIGCHLIQGYFIQRPTVDIDEIIGKYVHIADIVQKASRVSGSISKIEAHLDKIQAIDISTKMSAVIEYFKKNNQTTVIPVVNIYNEPLGILQESQIKEFLYSPYGIALLLNDGPNKSKLQNLIKECGHTDINSSMSTIIELFSNNTQSVGIIITQDSQYYGFLSARAIITIMNEENLILAIDQNPLTKLPGNRMIEKYISESASSSKEYMLCYFDLDNFKAFNDAYGFRNGDRVIQLFADMLKKELPKEYFKGHIGGDDFFAGVMINQKNEQEHLNDILNITQKFANNARDFYTQENKDRGYIIAKDRANNVQKFPLLSVSSSVLILHTNTKIRSLDSINKILSLQKKVAKAEALHVAISVLL